MLQGRPTWKRKKYKKKNKTEQKLPARDNIPPTIEFLRLSPGPQLRFWLCAPWNFWLLSKGKDRLICTNLIQYRNRGFSNPLFFILFYIFIILFIYLFTYLNWRVVRSTLSLWERGEIRASYFMPHWFQCFSEGFYFALLCQCYL